MSCLCGYLNLPFGLGWRGVWERVEVVMLFACWGSIGSFEDAVDAVPACKLY